MGIGRRTGRGPLSRRPAPERPRLACGVEARPDLDRVPIPRRSRASGPSRGGRSAPPAAARSAAEPPPPRPVRATAALLGVSLLGTLLVVGATQEADRQREAAVVEATSARRSRCAGPSATSPHSSQPRRTGGGPTTRALAAPCSASSPPRRDSSGTGTCRDGLDRRGGDRGYRACSRRPRRRIGRRRRHGVRALGAGARHRRTARRRRAPTARSGERRRTSRRDPPPHRFADGTGTGLPDTDRRSGNLPVPARRSDDRSHPAGAHRARPRGGRRSP